MSMKIQTAEGDIYEYNPKTELISLNGVIVRGDDYEPAFTLSTNPDVPPTFSGILLKKSKKIIGLSGKISGLVDSKQIEV